MSTIGNQALPFDPSRSSGKPRDAQRFNGDGATLTFTLSLAVDSAVDIDVYVDNIPQEPLTAYDVNGASITFTEAPPVGTNNVYVVYRNYQTGISTSVADGSISYQKLANNIRLFTTDNFTGDNTTVAFALTTAPADANTVFVSVDGIVQRAPIHYTTSGTTITFTSAPPTSSNVHVRHLGFRTTSTVTALSANTTITQPVLASPSFTGTVQTGAAFTGTLTTTGILDTTNTTDATSTASASVTTLGGLGVAKKLYVGDTIRIPNSTYIKARNAGNSADQLMMAVNAADVLFVNGSFTASVANTGTLSLGTLQKGLLVIVDNSADACGIFVVSNLITYEISDPDSKFSATAATASMTNLYNSAGSVILQNNSGGTRSYSITLIQ